MTLYVHRAERSDALASALAELLATPLVGVFVQEVIAVPARGVERWLTQQLSHRLGRRDGRSDGICAGVRFPAVAALMSEIISGPARHADPWSPDALVWPLLEVIDESADQDWCVTLGRHLGMGAGPVDPQQNDDHRHRAGRRHAVARRLAGLFDSYASNRPAMLTDWAAHRDTDGFAQLLPADLKWQAELWRRVASKIGTDDPVRWRQRASEQLRSDPAAVDLPDRISLFGPTRLSSGYLEVLSAVAVHRDVHLWLPHPSPALWDQLAGHTAGRSRRQHATAAATHPLLASLGRDSRELQLAINVLEHVDLHHELPIGPTTLLSRLQDDIRADRAAPGLTPTDAAARDQSVQVHACHGPARQVEVLREVLVGLLAKDHTLEPRDVLVMCPDIEVYAPLIAAAFGLADVVPPAQAHPAHRLRVRLADRALTQTNPLLATVAKLLELADSRVSASQVLDLAASAPVRRRFGFDDDNLEQISRWVAQSGVRWGLDAEHRAPFGLQRFPQNTWRSGVDRILLGVAMADEDQNRLGLALPLDDVGSGDVELAGQLAELLDRLQSCLDSLSGTRTLQHWLDSLSRAIDILTDVPADDSWQQAEVRREFNEVAAAAGERLFHVKLTLSDIRSLLNGRLGGRPTRANFRTGTLTVCTMVPMRSVPHRVVALLGLDDGVFPRHPRPDGDDILAREPAVGERDSRSEDRQLMLDAILAATEHLVITYTGADERTGAVRPPAVPLGELMDVFADAETDILTRHPLQPFDSKNMVAGALGTAGAFSYDAVALAGACAAAGRRDEPAPFLREPLPPIIRQEVDLSEMTALLVHPASGFLRQRLDIATRYDEPEPSDCLTVELDNLQQWAVGERLLRDRLSGIDDAGCRQAEWRRGVLPPGPLGQATLDFVLGEVAPLVDQTQDLMRLGRRAVDVRIPLRAGRELRGTVPEVYGTTVISLGYSKLNGKAQLIAWVALLALAAAHPERPWTSMALGRGEPGKPRSATFGPLNQATATTYLEQLVELYDQGLREPLPLPLKTSFAYAEAAAKLEEDDRALVAARRAWVSAKFPGEDVDASHTLLWGAAAPFDQVFGKPATRLTELSTVLWGPLLQHRRSATR